MWYVMQVFTGDEDNTITLIHDIVDPAIYGRCFYPVRKMLRKLRGQMQRIEERMIPGYIFIVTDDVERLFGALKRVPKFTKLLGNPEEIIIPLNEKEIEWMESLGLGSDERTRNGKSEIALTRVRVAEDRTVTILSGPLENVQGRILKYDLHKRKAEIAVNFMGRDTVLHLGIEIVGTDTPADNSILSGMGTGKGKENPVGSDEL